MEKNVFWEKFISSLSATISNVSFNTWFNDMKLYDLNDEKILLTVPYDSIKDHLINNYYEILEDIITNILGINLKIDFLLESDIRKEKNINIDDQENNNEIEYYKYYSNFNKKYTFENFVVGNSNRFAYSSAVAVAEKPGKLYNPLFLYGKSGLGKTHLMHAIGNYIKKNSNKKVLYITTEQFVNDFVNINKKDTGNNITYIEMFKKKYRNVDVLMIDDIQFLGSATMSQQEFTNTFNSLYDNEKQIIISSDRSVDDLKLLEDRLKTRFNWGLKADINPPDYELKRKIIEKKITNEDLLLNLNNDIIDYIAANCGNDVRNLEGFLIRLMAYQAIMNINTLTLEDSMEALKDYTNNPIYSNNTIAGIQNVVAKYFKVSVDDLKGKKKHKAIIQARQIAMYLCRMMTEETYPRIGLEFGGKDHSTIIYAYEKINNEIKHNGQLKLIVEELKQQIKS